jgi:hypothetical protein
VLRDFSIMESEEDDLLQDLLLKVKGNKMIRELQKYLGTK